MIITFRLQVEEAVHTAILTLKEGFEGAIDENNIEVGIIREGGPFAGKFVKLTPAVLKDYLQELE